MTFHNRAPVVYHSSMQKIASLPVTKAEMNMVVTLIKGIQFVYKIKKLLRLKVTMHMNPVVAFLVQP